MVRARSNCLVGQKNSGPPDRKIPPGGMSPADGIFLSVIPLIIRCVDTSCVEISNAVIIDPLECLCCVVKSVIAVIHTIIAGIGPVAFFHKYAVHINILVIQRKAGTDLAVEFSYLCLCLLL